MLSKFRFASRLIHAPINASFVGIIRAVPDALGQVGELPHALKIGDAVILPRSARMRANIINVVLVNIDAAENLLVPDRGHRRFKRLVRLDFQYCLGGKSDFILRDSFCLVQINKHGAFLLYSELRKRPRRSGAF